jgi:arylformamidase
MAAVDISIPLVAGMPTFPGDPPFRAASLKSLERGDPYRLSRLELGSHTGTHLDPPAHFLEGGAGPEGFDLEVLNGPCDLVEVRPRGPTVRAEDLTGVPRGTTRLLLKTPNSARWARRLEFFPEFVGLGPEAADYLLERGVRLVGIDALSIESDPTETYPVHRALLGRGVAILEGLLLEPVTTGRFELLCLPLRLDGMDGAPARAVLRPG